MRMLVLALLLVHATAARADALPAYRPPDFLAAPPALPSGYDASNALKLDLSQTIELAMRQNLGIVLERKQMASRTLSEAAASSSMYEPTVSANYSHASSDQPPLTAQAGPAGAIIASTSDSVGTTVSQRLPTGASLSLGFSTSRVGSTAGTAVEPLTYNSMLSFSISQPLLHGFSTDLAIPQYSILTAKIATAQERHQFEITAATLVQQTEVAYWDVVQALYSYDVAVESKQLAEQTVALVKRQEDAGMIGSAELTGAQSTFAQRELAVLSASETVEQTWDALRTIINLPRDQWTRAIQPTEPLEFHPTETAQADAAFQTALARRPEIADLALDLQASDLALRKAENDKLPEIDLGVSGSVYGQGDTLGSTFDQMGSRDATGWSVMLNMTWTPLNRTNKINAEIARIARDTRVTNRDQRVQGIWNEVRAAVRNQHAAAAQVVAASRSRDLARQSLEIETRKYASGQSSNVDIATLQSELASAQLAELTAVLGHEKATTAVLLATGELLARRNIAVELTKR